MIEDINDVIQILKDSDRIPIGMSEKYVSLPESTIDEMIFVLGETVEMIDELEGEIIWSR